MYNDLSHYLLTISIFSAFIIKYSSITQRWILSFYFIISSLSFYAALVGYIDSDFSVYNIFTNSNANTPLFYKISSTWSNHEGSLLLWCWFLTLYGFVFCYSITIFESKRPLFNCSLPKNRERSFYELLCCNTVLKNSIDKKPGKDHAILFVNQSKKQPGTKHVHDKKQEQTKSDQVFSENKKDNHCVLTAAGQIENTTTARLQLKEAVLFFSRDKSLATQCLERSGLICSKLQAANKKALLRAAAVKSTAEQKNENTNTTQRVEIQHRDTVQCNQIRQSITTTRVECLAASAAVFVPQLFFFLLAAVKHTDVTQSCNSNSVLLHFFVQPEKKQQTPKTKTDKKKQFCSSFFRMESFFVTQKYKEQITPSIFFSFKKQTQTQTQTQKERVTSNCSSIFLFSRKMLVSSNCSQNTQHIRKYEKTNDCSYNNNKNVRETVLFKKNTTLFFQALLKNPLESLIQEKQLYPQKYTEIDHLGSFKRFKPFANTYSMQKKLYRHDLKKAAVRQRTLFFLPKSPKAVFVEKSISWPHLFFEVYSNRNRFNTAWISFCFSKFNQWKNTRQRTQPFVIYVSIILWFLAFLLMTSNPFLKTPFLCINSVTELNPVLQDPVLAIHPPCIYAGYVASAIGFSIALSYLSQPFLFVATATTATKTRGKHIQLQLETERKTVATFCCFAAVLQNCFVVVLNKIWNTFKVLFTGLYAICVLSINTLVDKAKTQWFCVNTTAELLLFFCRTIVLAEKKTQLMLLTAAWPLAIFVSNSFLFTVRLTAASGVFFLGLTAAAAVTAVRLLGTNKKTAAWLQKKKQEGCSYKTQKTNTHIDRTNCRTASSSKCALLTAAEQSSFLQRLQLHQHKTRYTQTAAEVFPFLLLPNCSLKLQPGDNTSLNFQEQRLQFKWLLAEFTKQTRFWILTCWCFLTIGILLGSWWAYHELGWGGWWFWDPVENASLMPWLMATACIHSGCSLAPGSKENSRTKNAALQSWTFLLSIVTFMLSILGTFFVRSGLLASVHSFATDSTRGLFILCFLLCVFFLSITFFIRWLLNYNNQLRLKIPKATFNRKQDLQLKPLKLPLNTTAATHKYKKQIEQVLQIQNVILCIICLVILCGTAAPILFQWLFQRDVSTGASFFNATTIPLFLTAILVMIYVHYAQLIYLKNGRSEKIALWEWNVFYPNCISNCRTASTQLAHPKQTASFSVCTAVLFNKTPCLLKRTAEQTKNKMRAAVLLTAALQLFVSILSLLRSFVEYRVHNCSLDNSCKQKTTFCSCSPTNCSVFVFFSHVLILHYLTDFSYLESILAALCFVLCCYIVMSSTHQTLFFYAVRLQLKNTSKKQAKQFCSSVICSAASTKLLRKKLKDRLFHKLVKKTRSVFFASVYSFVVFHWMLNKLENKTPNSLRLEKHTKSKFMSKNCKQKELQQLQSNKFIAENMKGHQCNKSGTWSESIYKAENIAMDKQKTSCSFFVLSSKLQPVDKTQFYSNTEKTPNVFSEMKHKSFLTTASRLIMLIDKNPFRRIAFNMRLSHIGVIIFLIGVIVSNRKKIQLVQIMRFGQQVQLDNSICSLRSIDQNYGPTYHSICGNIIIQPQTTQFQHVTSSCSSFFLGLNDWNKKQSFVPYGKNPSKALCLTEQIYSSSEHKNTFSSDTNSCLGLQLHTGSFFLEPHICMFPEKRFFFSNPTLSATKVAIYTNLFTDFYALIGTGSAETGWYTTIMQLPFIFCIWIGFLVAASGGLYSLRLLMKTSHLKWQ